MNFLLLFLGVVVGSFFFRVGQNLAKEYLYRKREKRIRSRALRMAIEHFYQQKGEPLPVWWFEYVLGPPETRLLSMGYVLADLHRMGWFKDCHERVEI